jgi:hypothetical protein
MFDSSKGITSQEGDRSIICVLRVSNIPLSMIIICLFDCGTIPTVWLYFHIITWMSCRSLFFIKNICCPGMTYTTTCQYCRMFTEFNIGSLLLVNFLTGK